MQNGNYSKSSRSDLLLQKLKSNKPSIPVSTSKQSELSHRIEVLNEDFSNHEYELSKALEQITYEIKKIQKLYAEGEGFRQKNSLRAKDGIDKTGQRLKKQITKHVKERQNSDNFLLNSIQQSVSICKQAISQEQQYSKSSTQVFQTTIHSDLPKLQEVVNKQKLERQGTHDQIVESTTKLLLQIQNDLRDIRVQRTQTIQSVRSMLQELVVNTEQEIEEQKRNRQQTEISILQLIQSMYDKVMG